MLRPWLWRRFLPPFTAALFGASLALATEPQKAPPAATAPQQDVAAGEFPNPAGYTLEELAEINLQARVREATLCAAAKDILGWGRALFPEKFNVPFCRELHEYLVDIRHEPFASTEAPRGHAKTTIRCFLIPIFQALEEPELYNHYLNVQATDEKALAINVTIKTEFEENKRLQRMYGNVRGDRWTNGQFVIRVKDKRLREREVIFTAKSAGQSIRGINYNSKRPDYIIVDDLYNEEDLNNPDSTKKKNAWFKGALMNCRAKTKPSVVALLGTAFNLHDQLEQNKRNAKAGPLTDVPGAKPEGRWVCRTFKAVKDMAQKVVLWPELNTYDSLMEELKDQASIIFYREFQNERWDETTAIVKRSWLYPEGAVKSWEYDPATEPIFDPKRRRLLGVLLGVDPSIGKKLENDDTAMVLVWKTMDVDAKAPEYWIDWADAKHMTLNERVEALQHLADSRPPARRITKAILEAVGGFQDFAAEAKRRVSGLPITEVAKVKDKISNLMTKSLHFEHGRVHLNKNLPTALKDKIVYQLTTNYPDHDDLRDALLLCLDSNNVTMWDRI